MDIQQKAAIQLEISNLELLIQQAQGMDKMFLMDEQLELKRILQEWKPPKQDESCPSCSG